MAYSEARKKATAKYKDQHYKRIPLDVPIEFFDTIKVQAKASGESVNGFIKKAVTDRIGRAFAMRFDVVAEVCRRDDVELVALDETPETRYHSGYDVVYNLVKDGEIVNTMKFENLLDEVERQEEGVYYLPASPDYVGICEDNGKPVCRSIWDCRRIAHEEGIAFDEFMDNMRIATEEEVSECAVRR